MPELQTTIGQGANRNGESARRLWCAVVLRQIMDSQYNIGPPPVFEDYPDDEAGMRQFHSACSGWRYRTRLRDDARKWLVEAGPGMREVCLLAGINADDVRRAFMAGRIPKIHEADVEIGNSRREVA